MSNVSFDVIESFLEGRDPQKYIVAIESSYNDNFVDLVINDPETGKRIERHHFKPFIWIKQDVANIIYGGNKAKTRENAKRFGVKIKPLIISSDDGFIPERMDNGYKFLAETTEGFMSLILFFKEGGIDIWNEYYRPLFLTLSPSEQFLIQTGKRLFKGIDDYNGLHRLQFDLETAGLDPSRHEIFQIGIKDNRGFELILETKGDTPKDRRESEKDNIIAFFKIIDELHPDLITAYNSENFDWPFFERRCERLSIDFNKVVKTLNPGAKVKRKESQLKLGQETINYQQTYMWGYNILDISHAVRRAQAINSDIKQWSLKYITKFSKVAKKNRVYVPGDKINFTWADTRDYWFNDENGSWGLLDTLLDKESNLSDETVDKLLNDGGLTRVKGDFIVQRYLLDDLWETEQIDYIYNQASFLLAKILPTSYMRSSTMGTAGQWKLIMCAWSYENGLGIPRLEPKREFTGGLSRLLKVGYAGENGVVKFDFAALYPKAQLTWKIFPSLDITGVMEGLLTYVVDKRDEFKFLTGEHKDETKRLKELLEKNSDKLTPERIAKGKEMINAEAKLSSDYDKKQLPLKILANSWFGSYGAPYLFPWGDTDCAEETTCRGRQSLRLMVRFFKGKYNFEPLVLDTDGCNFIIPKNINDIKYIVKASHWKTERYTAGTELIGLDAALAEFNETYMEGRMGLDIDDIYDASINFKRKNYANKIDGKTKLVGNSIKSKSMPTYIEEFINEGVELLLDGKGYEFIELYYNTVNKIYNYQIPAIKIASKSKVKMLLADYKNVYCNGKNKNGNSKSRQAHMELAMKEDLKVDIGDVIYYINTGTAKSHSDIKAVKNKETGAIEVGFNCQLIPQEQIESNPDLLVEDYNVAKYLEALNKRIESLLVCFDTDIRDRILIGLEKDKKTKTTRLQQRSVFTELECKLVSGKPLDPSDQDDYEEDLMKMEDREIKFWMSVNKIPNFIEEDKWLEITVDYVERMRIAKEEGIKSEKKEVLDLLKRLEVSDYKKMKNYNKLPVKLDSLIYVTNDSIMSKKWEEPLYPSITLFDYEDEANERALWYTSVENGADNTYDMWLDYKAEVEGMSGDTLTYSASTSTYISGVDTANEDDESITTFVKLDDDIIQVVKNEEEESEWNF
jgi:DNA polymerase elongation subunit (family B)